MPPRRASVRRNKPTATTATTPVAAHQSPAPKVNPSDDLKVNEPVPEIPVPEQVSDPNPAEIEAVAVDVASESMKKEELNESKDENGVVEEDLPLGSEAVDEGKKVVDEETKEEEDVEEIENSDEEPEEGEEQEEDEEEPEEDEEPEEEQNAEIDSAQEETTATQVDDSKILNDNNNDVKDSDIGKSLCKNNDDIKGTTDMTSIQAVSTQTLAIEEDSMEDMYDDESDDENEGDDADNGGGEDQDPSIIGQDSSPDNKKEKGTELYVGKLDKNVVEEDLVNIFQQFGELKSTRIVRKPNNNKSKGFAFVRFASVDQAKRALSELKDGVEVRGKRVVISASQDNDTLYLGNICKTWTKEQVLQQLKEYGIGNIEVLRIPEDPKIDKKNKGFAFLEFKTHADAVEAFKRLKKPDVVFGRDISAKVAFAETPKHLSDEDMSHVTKVRLEGITKDWTEEKVKDICEKYGEIVKINLRPSTRGKYKDFGFVTFNSPESTRACVEGINNTAIGGEAKIKASIAKSQQMGQIQKQGFQGGYKVEKQSENSNKKTQSKSSKMKGVSNAQQAKTNKKHPSKNKMKDNIVKPQQKGPHKKDGESSKEAGLSKMKGDNASQHGQRKRKASSEQKLNAPDLGTPKKPRNGGQAQNSQPVSKAGSNKRKNASGNEAREDRGNRNAQGKKPFKKQKGNMHGRERDNFRKPKSDAYTRRGRDEYRNSSRYIDPYAAPKYAASASNDYHVASDHSLSTRRYKEMEPHAGYIEPSRSGYAPQHVVRATHSQHHQSMYLGPPSTGQSQLYPRYLDQPVMSQSHRGGYIETTAVAPEVQPYRDYRPSAIVHVARSPYESGLARVRHDDRGAGATYVGGPPLSASQVPDRTNYLGPPLSASQVPDRTNYYQAAGGSYGGAYNAHRGYY
ncbi:putative RNA recognition motif domain, nucleotide-binding alpha-beta plait domain superfamily [Helianthus annuus]|uniref:Putative nucleotide-binding alpha-beta plait domain-containing protein n=1 Tax=Helianthus annuus TaxID=4232 RepID=A0A251U5A2_HELAN|nr:nucleolin isoform X1 [Helianthus annuus]KAF5795239.1 putative RNA recognition motif domain, nucleotide-binding alpha-beta plait domain superfamily [Helianthus annuus]KAJ0538773.1 putative RNA recognition motif domain, nucleotide-binding alpha-beta plait domain superfamily [Helianthus annuus]KAJ0722314.1 putative RNA recognition motif domain, nucleotide-binding alpha-beta plait domain superfamily [Helianthus annuus]